MTTEPRPATPRVPPTLGRGIAVAILYAAVFLVAGLVSGVDYDEVSQTTGNVLGFVVIPVGLGIIATLALTARWGWWHDLFHEAKQLTEPRWARLVPVFFVLTIVVQLLVAPWGDWNAGLVLLILAGCLMVGFGEEIVFRGYLLLGARARYSEVGAWFTSSLLFGLFHGLNLFTGQAVGPTVTQIVFAFVMGSGLYVIRRVSGLLVVGMVIHGFWDFATFVGAGRGDTQSSVRPESLIVTPFVWVTMALAIGVIVSIARRQKAQAAAA